MVFDKCMPRMLSCGFVSGILSFSASPLLAQDNAVNAPPKTIRAEYRSTSALPDGWAFYSTMSMLSLLTSENQRDVAVSLIVDGMGLSQSDADEFLSMLLSRREAYQGDYDGRVRRLACSNMSEQPPNDQIYEMFDAMDDLTLQLATSYLQLTIEELDQDKAARFRGWLDSSKDAITRVVVRHKEHYEQTGADAGIVLDAICGRLNQ